MQYKTKFPIEEQASDDLNDASMLELDQSIELAWTEDVILKFDALL